eukprot:sb/3475766/
MNTVVENSQANILIDIPSLVGLIVKNTCSLNPTYHRGSRFEKFTNTKLLGLHCIPHKSCRELYGRHFGTRVFVLAQCIRCLMTTIYLTIGKTWDVNLATKMFVCQFFSKLFLMSYDQFNGARS